ncbi:hypothetical protein FD755_008692 [Muntiacus reevesi]|uniref:Uncharacterized protein n=2 Tax=Muntiacus TaxID=9885 RepID=A0A5J5MQ87_MUNRE|nr:hypothetical protein FD754_007631 [Muntiacus muntjak]KAB0380908.1 hypothetical protein FD755_008692 [Muntiacus reevesi]
MAFQKAVKGTILVGGGALATVLGLSHFAHYKRKQPATLLGVPCPERELPCEKHVLGRINLLACILKKKKAKF